MPRPSPQPQEHEKVDVTGAGGRLVVLARLLVGDRVDDVVEQVPVCVRELVRRVSVTRHLFVGKGLVGLRVVDLLEAEKWVGLRDGALLDIADR